jgi:hypothetical protein
MHLIIAIIVVTTKSETLSYKREIEEYEKVMFLDLKKTKFRIKNECEIWRVK